MLEPDFFQQRSTHALNQRALQLVTNTFGIDDPTADDGAHDFSYVNRSRIEVNLAIGNCGRLSATRWAANAATPSCELAGGEKFAPAIQLFAPPQVSRKIEWPRHR